MFKKRAEEVKWKMALKKRGLEKRALAYTLLLVGLGLLLLYLTIAKMDTFGKGQE
jgi:hypothetical protein